MRICSCFVCTIGPTEVTGFNWTWQGLRTTINASTNCREISNINCRLLDETFFDQMLSSNRIFNIFLVYQFKKNCHFYISGRISHWRLMIVRLQCIHSCFNNNNTYLIITASAYQYSISQDSPFVISLTFLLSLKGACSFETQHQLKTNTSLQAGMQDLFKRAKERMLKN